MAGARLPRAPWAVASTGGVVAVVDQAGALLCVAWPGGEPIVVRAHGDAGPVAAVAGEVATAGGWDTAVTRWDPVQARRRWTGHPFDGRVTALAGQGQDLLVAGADRSPAAAGRGGGARVDRIALGQGRVVRLGPEGDIGPTVAEVPGSIDALAAGPGWVALLHSSAVSLARPGDEPLALLPDRPAATALGVRQTELVVADADGVVAVDAANGSRREVARAGPDDGRVLSLAVLDGAVFAATGPGLVRWPGGDRMARNGRRPAAICAHCDASMLVAWSDGVLEERNRSGAVLHAMAVTAAG